MSTYLVCDRCGDVSDRGKHKRDPRVLDFTCAVCGSTAAWGFERLEKARLYSSDVRDRVARQRA